MSLIITTEPGRTGSYSRRDRIFIFHVFPTFGVGGVQARMVEVINNLGNKFCHAILALDRNYACGDRLSSDVDVDLLTAFREQRGAIRGIPARRATLRLLRPDLLLTYNWGAIDWAFSNTVSPICRHIHLESGFGIEEADHRFIRRSLFRRIALARTHKIVVPSETLVQIATRDWNLPTASIVHIPNGIDCVRFNDSEECSPGIRSRVSPGALVIGAVGPLRPEKNLLFLLDAFAAVSVKHNVNLVIMGNGSERIALKDHAQALGVSDKVIFTGHLDSIEKALACLDVFALTSRTEQMPNGVLQAMAASKVVVATDVGDVKLMLCEDNRPFVAQAGNLEAFVVALEQVLSDSDFRARVGARNRIHVQAHYSQMHMVDAYRKLLLSSVRRSNPRGLDVAEIGHPERNEHVAGRD